ncbi:MAG: hypothetical protein WCC48_11105 [Anaeromyxobacteraceae bacterium]
MDDQETFAQRSFLGLVGRDSANEGEALAWSLGIRLPTRDIRVEAKALLMLEATFQISWFSSIGSETRLVIRPGLVYPDSSLEIELETSWSNWGRNRFAIGVNLMDDEVVQLSGPFLMKKDSVIERDAGGNVTEVSINVEDPTFPRDRPGQWQAVRAWVRLRLDSKVFVPDDKDLGMPADLPNGSAVLSRDKTAWKSKSKWEARE